MTQDNTVMRDCMLCDHPLGMPQQHDLSETGLRFIYTKHSTLLTFAAQDHSMWAAEMREDLRYGDQCHHVHVYHMHRIEQLTSLSKMFDMMGM